jgi:hypothetical protein
VDGATVAEPDQVVLVSEPFRRPARYWHTFTPNLAKVVGMSDETCTRIADERRSKMTFEIEPLGQTVS